jgi:hypothetical protein
MAELRTRLFSVLWAEADLSTWSGQMLDKERSELATVVRATLHEAYEAGADCASSHHVEANLVLRIRAVGPESRLKLSKQYVALIEAAGEIPHPTTYAHLSLWWTRFVFAEFTAANTRVVRAFPSLPHPTPRASLPTVSLFISHASFLPAAAMPLCRFFAAMSLCRYVAMSLWLGGVRARGEAGWVVGKARGGEGGGGAPLHRELTRASCLVGRRFSLPCRRHRRKTCAARRTSR